MGRGGNEENELSLEGAQTLRNSNKYKHTKSTNNLLYGDENTLINIE